MARNIQYSEKYADELYEYRSEIVAVYKDMGQNYSQCLDNPYRQYLTKTIVFTGM
jgi:hypothetical protein